MAGEIFISYRREDSAGTTGRIYDRIIAAVPRNKVFMDVDAAMHGLDFQQVLNDKIAASDVVAVVIGPSWLTVTDSTGCRRIDNPQDFVRIEVGAALRRDIPVVPVLVDGAAMPSESDLPPDLKALSRRHAVEVRNTRFGDDADTLVNVLLQRLGLSKSRKWPKSASVAALTAVAMAIVATLVIWAEPDTLSRFGLASITGRALDFEQTSSTVQEAARSTVQEAARTSSRTAQTAAEEARKALEARERDEAEKRIQEREFRERIARLEAEAQARTAAEAKARDAYAVAEMARKAKEERERSEAEAERRNLQIQQQLARLEAETQARTAAEVRARAEVEARVRAEAEARAIAEAEVLRRQQEEAERQRLAAAAAPTVGIASLPICERLWHQRNAVFRKFGYCFGTGKAMMVFGNTNCFRNMDETWRAMGDDNRRIVNRIKDEERANGC